jgi:hypothetical protein
MWTSFHASNCIRNRYLVFVLRIQRHGHWNRHEKNINYIGFEVLTVVVMKASIIWVITPCSALKVNRRFIGKCHLFKDEEKAKKETSTKLLLVASFILVSLQSWKLTRHVPPKRRLTFQQTTLRYVTKDRRLQH